MTPKESIHKTITSTEKEISLLDPSMVFEVIGNQTSYKELKKILTNNNQILKGLKQNITL